MIFVVCMACATVIWIIFLMLFLSANQNLTKAMLTSKCEHELENIKKSQIELQLLAKSVKDASGNTDKTLIKKGKKKKKELDECKKRLESYKAGRITGFDMIPVAGYRLIQLLGWDGTNTYIKNLSIKCQQFKEKKEAINYTYYIFGNLFGFMILGLGGFFAAIAVGMAGNMGNRTMIIAAVVLGLSFVAGYLPYDAIGSTVNKRTEEIENQFPQVASKLALLVIAGLEVSHAWQLTMNSGTGTLYEEMNRVYIDLSNNVSPIEAYSKFLNRCNNKYTTKLATSIIQNSSKGNSEIVKLFSDLNAESWMEHKHNARRMGEKIQSKLMAPTLLMFLGIIILVIVPAVSGFSM